MVETASNERTKDYGAPSIQCPMLTATNYTVWAMRMRMTLRVSSVWDTIEQGSSDPIKNDVAIALLFQSIPETLILQVGEQSSAKKLWEAIKSRHQGADRVKEARLQTLRADLDRLKMEDSSTVDEFAGKISGIAAQSASLGETIEEAKLVKKFLTSLPRSKFIQIVASLEQVLDLNTVGWEDIVGRIKAYEERIGEESRSDDQGKLLFTNSSGYGRGSRGSSRGYRGRGRGRGDQGRGRGEYGRGGGGTDSGRSRDENSRGRGGYGRGDSGRGRGRGRGRSSGHEDEAEDHSQRQKRDLSKITCWRCGKTGHYAMSCTETITHETNLNETEEADALYIHEVVFLNEEKVFPKTLDTTNKEVWYLDNGASNHMTGNREFFTSLDETIKGRVRFGDGSFVKIVGKGSITFVGKTGERRSLKEIYYIPDLKHNIVSLGQATESGCEVRMKGAILTLKDSAGRLLVQVTRSPNRLYKTPIEVEYPRCLLAQDNSVPTATWHARLGHISIGVMNNMVKQEMVVGMPKMVHEKNVCEACLVGKQVRHSFPKKASYRASKVLELVHGDLCGPISPPTPAGNRYVFVLIDDFSRYMWTMLLKEKSEAFNRFKKFKEFVGTQTDCSIKTFRTDRGGEFTSLEFNGFCEENGIARHLTAPYTPQQNGVVERRNRTLMEMTRRFEMSDLGKLSYYLGIEVSQGAKGIQIKQGRYAHGILEDTKMDLCNSALVPLEQNIVVSKAEKEPEIDATRYRRTIGCLRYLIHTRPDLAFAVGVLSRYMQSPRESHGQALKHVLRYVKGTTNLGLFFKREESRRLIGYSDSSHNIDVDDGRSTSGHMFYLGSSLITWTSQKQQTVALSSCEAEFMAATEAAKQAIWLKELLKEILGMDGKVMLRVDNKSAIALTKNPVFHGRSKHILSRYHFIRECVENGHIEVEHVPGTEQKADILTKALAKIKFKEMRELIGVEASEDPEVHDGIKGVNVG